MPGTLAGEELIGMEPASNFAFEMSYCGSPPQMETLWTRWNFEPLLLSVLLIAAFAGSATLRNAGASRQWSFSAAWLGAAVLFISPLCALTVALFSARVGHHIALTMGVAPMLALALPPAWGRHLNLLPTLVVSTIALWIWHAPDIYAASFTHPAIYWLMQFSLLTSFTAFWLSLLRAENAVGVGVAALSGAMQMGLLGALLVFAPGPLYLPHLATTAGFGLVPLEDQQLGGLIMWVPANLPLLALVLWRLIVMLQPAQRVSPR
ncbi:MAG TPA: cytochrome c oxidase assembly protein [Devosia sp.]|nr:cytochrome c oxidase assembly protein [Devosia sp.]